MGGGEVSRRGETVGGMEARRTRGMRRRRAGGVSDRVTVTTSH